MSIEKGFIGRIPVKEDVTIEQIILLYRQHLDDDAPFEPATGMPDLYDVGEGTIHFLAATTGKPLLDYDIYTTSWTFAEAFEAFLGELAASYASEGWIDYDPQDHDEETTYGPDPVAAAEAAVKAAEGALTAAQEVLAFRLTELQKARDANKGET